MHGNTASAEAKLIQLDGDMSLWSVGSHKVRFKGNTASCVCHGFLKTGKCTHLETARAARRGLGIVATPALENRTSRKSGSSSRPSSVVERGRIATASMKSIEGLGSCFHGLVEKAKTMGQNRGEVRPAVAQQEALLDTTRVREGLSLDSARDDYAALAVVSRLGAVSHPPPDSGGPNIKFLMGRETHDEIRRLLSSSEGGEVCITAYTFDQPDLAESLIEFKGSVRMIADMGQSQGNRTKLQMQTIQQVSRSGVRVRLCSGAPVHESYKEDRRAVNVGRSIRGLQHSKTMLVRTADKTCLVIGSANWTTASRSNVEMGVSIEGRSDLEVFTDYAANFDRIWQEAQLPQGAQSSNG